MSLDDLLFQCSTTQGRAGANRVWFMPGCDIASGGVASGVANTSSFGTTTNVTAKTFFRYDYEPDTASLAVEGNNDNGTPSYSVTMTMKLNAVGESELYLLEQLANTNNLVCVVEENNSAGTNAKARLLGYDSIRGNRFGGKVKIDSNIDAEMTGDYSFTITFTAMMATHPYFIVGDITCDTDGTVSLGA